MTLSYKVIWGPYKNVPPQQQQQQQQQQQLGPLLDLTAIAAGKNRAWNGEGRKMKAPSPPVARIRFNKNRLCLERTTITFSFFAPILFLRRNLLLLFDPFKINKKILSMRVKYWGPENSKYREMKWCHILLLIGPLGHPDPWSLSVLIDRESMLHDEKGYLTILLLLNSRLSFSELRPNGEFATCEDGCKKARCPRFWDGYKRAKRQGSSTKWLLGSQSPLLLTPHWKRDEI